MDIIVYGFAAIGALVLILVAGVACSAKYENWRDRNKVYTRSPPPPISKDELKRYLDMSEYFLSQTERHIDMIKRWSHQEQFLIVIKEYYPEHYDRIVKMMVLI